jgi:hypothetical protein
MFQLIILGLLFLFIVLHFYTDITNYLHTGKVMEGNANASDFTDAGNAANLATEQTNSSSNNTTNSSTNNTTNSIDNKSNTSLPDGVCTYTGGNDAFRSSCTSYTDETNCINATYGDKKNICEWAPSEYVYKSPENSTSNKICSVKDKACAKNCVKPTNWSGNCSIEFAKSNGEKVKNCGWKCNEDLNDIYSCQYQTDCQGCPCHEVSKVTHDTHSPQKRFDFTDPNWRNKHAEASKMSDSNYGAGNSIDDSIDYNKTFLDENTVKKVFEDDNIIPSDMDLNTDRSHNFERIGNNVINKIITIRNLDTPIIDDSDKELIGRSYRQVYEIKKGNDKLAIKSIENRFKNTMYSILTKSSLTGENINWDTPKTTSSLDSTTGMFNDNSNKFFAQGDLAKNDNKKPEDGLCLWKGCDKSPKKPYDSIWSLY